MKIATLYLDTSIIGGYFDEEFAEPTRLLWRQMEKGRWRFVTSLLVGQEMTGAPDDVRTLMTTTFTQSDLLPLTLERSNSLPQPISINPSSQLALRTTLGTLQRRRFIAWITS